MRKQMIDYVEEQEERVIAHQHRVALEEAAMRRAWNRIPQLDYRDFVPFHPSKYNERHKPSDIVPNADDWHTPLGLLQVQAFRALMKTYRNDKDRTPEMALAEAIVKTSDDNMGKALEHRPDLIAEWLE